MVIYNALSVIDRVLARYMDEEELEGFLKDRGGLPRGFLHVFRDTCERYETGEGDFHVLSSCVESSIVQGVDEQLVLTLLLGLLSVQEWYAENREIYESAKQLSDGNSKYSTQNASFVRTRRENNRFAKRDKECQIILGYMDACGVEKVTKKYVDPVAICVQTILQLPDYFEKKKVSIRSEFESEGEPVADEDLNDFKDDCRKYRDTQIYKRVRQRVEDYVASASSCRLALKASQKLFKEIHLSRTSVL